MAPHSSTLAWKISWTEEPDRLQSMGSQRVGHDWATSLSLFTFMHQRRKWQPTPVFLPGESQGQGSLVGCRLWGCTESDTTEATLAAAAGTESFILNSRIAALQVSLSFAVSQELLKLMSVELVMSSNHLILCCLLLLLCSVFPSIRVFSNNLALHSRWPKYWSFSFSISPSNEYSGISFRIDWFNPLAVWGTLKVFSKTTVQKHQFLALNPHVYVPVFTSVQDYWKNPSFH